METLLKVRDLVKTFGSLRAVNGVSFEIKRGAVIGLLGPNGAGKTTTIDILLGSTTPDSGTVEYFGRSFFEDKHAALRRINFASAYHNLQYRTTVRENLTVFANLYEVESPAGKIEELLSYFQIGDIASRRFGDLSAGQRTRVNLIKSMLNDPELILMDEPTASLDPDIADRTLSLIEDLRRDRDLSILFTSHNMDEVTRICDEVIFLNRGEVVARGAPQELARQNAEADVELVLQDGHVPVVSYLEGRNYRYREPRPRHIIVTVPEREISGLISGIDSLGVTILDVDIHKPDLEDVFLDIARRRHVVEKS